jgi:hypothetical protein
VRQQKLSAAQTLNEAVSGNNLFETNEKSLNSLYLKYLSLGMESFNNGEMLWIESLAQKCPYLDGQAVFKARTLYAMLTGARTYNDLEICNNQGIFKGGINWYEMENVSIGKQLRISAIEIQVHPNPTTGKVSFSSPNANFLNAEVQFFDLSGRKVLAIKNSVRSSQLEYDLADLPSGLYIYHLKYSNGDIYTGKLTKE